MTFFIITVAIFIMTIIVHATLLYLQQKDGRLEKWWGKNAFRNLQLISGSLWVLNLTTAIMLQFFPQEPLGIYDPAFMVIGGVLFIVGLILVLWTGRLLGLTVMMGARFFPGHSTKVIRSGVYQIFSNPMYIGYNLIYLGLALCLNSMYDIVLLIVSLIGFNLILSRIENKGINK